MLKVLGRANSINVQKVMWCCGELGVEVERTDIGGPFGGNDQPAYLKLNPNGKIPTLVDGDLVLWESNAIVRHIAATRGAGTPGADPWFPDAAARRAHANQWMDWYLTTLHLPMRVIFQSLIRTAPGERDRNGVADAVVEAAKAWAIVDAHLAAQPYLTGDTPTMGDIPAGASAYRWFTLDIERPDLSNLEAWYARLKARPAYREHVMLPLT